MDSLPPKSGSPLTTSEPEPLSEDPATSAKWLSKDVEHAEASPQTLKADQTKASELAKSRVSTSPTSPEDEVKEKPQLVFTPIDTSAPADYKTLSEAIFSLEWPDMGEFTKSMPEALSRIKHLAMTSKHPKTSEEKAFLFYHRALMHSRLNETAEAQKWLRKALELCSETIAEQIELSQALIFFSNPVVELDLDLAEKMAQILLDACSKGSIQANVKLLEISFGLYPESQTDTFMHDVPGRMYTLFNRLVHFRNNECNFTSVAGLSNFLHKPLFADSQSGDDDFVIANQLVWICLDASYGKECHKLPACHGHRGLSTADYDCFSRVILMLGLPWDGKPLRDTMRPSGLKDLKGRLLALLRFRSSETLSFRDAMAVFLLGYVHETGAIPDSSNKKSADCIPLNPKPVLQYLPARQRQSSKLRQQAYQKSLQVQQRR